MGCGASKDGAGGVAGDRPSKHNDPLVVNLEGLKNDPRLNTFSLFNVAIRELNISQCDLELIPEQISLLTSLLTLNVSQNRRMQHVGQRPW